MQVGTSQALDAIVEEEENSIRGTLVSRQSASNNHVDDALNMLDRIGQLTKDK